MHSVSPFTNSVCLDYLADRI